MIKRRLVESVSDPHEEHANSTGAIGREFEEEDQRLAEALLTGKIDLREAREQRMKTLARLLTSIENGLERLEEKRHRRAIEAAFRGRI